MLGRGMGNLFHEKRCQSVTQRSAQGEQGGYIERTGMERDPAWAQSRLYGGSGSRSIQGLSWLQMSCRRSAALPQFLGRSTYWRTLLLSTGERVIAAALTRRLICWQPNRDSQKMCNPGPMKGDCGSWARRQASAKRLGSCSRFQKTAGGG